MRPQLVFSPLDLKETVAQCVTTSSLIVTDDYNLPVIQDLGPCVCVRDQEFEHIEEVKAERQYDLIVAVGGCTALDFGRACAVGKRVIAIPTILSTSCLSTNCSVIKRNGVYRSERTQAPERTVISVPTIVRTHSDDIRKWSISGLGDLFASVSASIEYEYWHNNRQFSTVNVLEKIPAVVDAMAWVEGPLERFDEPALRRLATILHEASVNIIRFGKTELNAASEHWLYYKMQERRHYPKMTATHGKLVSIGTLLSCRILAEETADEGLYRRLRALHQKLGLPYRLADLEVLGVSLEHVTTGLADLADRECMYREYFSDGDCSIVGRIFT